MYGPLRPGVGHPTGWPAGPRLHGLMLYCLHIPSSPIHIRLIRSDPHARL